HLREIVRPTGGLNMGQLGELLIDPKGQMAASGWAILPMRQRSADSVLLAYDKGDSDPIIFARANVWMRRGDIAAEFGDNAYLHSGWTINWSRSDLPSGPIRITAWAFDAESCRAYE